MDITVVISGMVLLVAPIAYDGGSKNINAAVAVNAETFDGSYGVDVPIHIAKLKLIPDQVDKITGDVGRVTGKEIIRLKGDRIQLGTFNGSSCDAFGTAANATTTRTFSDVPSLSAILHKDDAKMAPNTYPISGSYAGVEKNLVAGWLEIPDGQLRAKHEHREDDFVEFRPGRRPAMVVKEVQWLAPSGNCIRVEPFGNVDNTKILSVSFRSVPNISINLTNEANMADGEAMPGVGYDFEILYNVVNDKANLAKIPPLPYAIVEPHKDPHTSGSTGVNCGPASLP